MSKEVTFITGNQHKADYLQQLLGFPLEHQKVDLDEIQSLDLQEVVDHKVRQAFQILGRPVLVEDVSLEFGALGKLPGTFIKWFQEEIGMDGLCRLLDNHDDRSATARCMFGYFDGGDVTFLEGSLEGSISEEPRGSKGFGWDEIFIPEGYDLTRAELDKQADIETYMTIKPIQALKDFLTSSPS